MAVRTVTHRQVPEGRNIMLEFIRNITSRRNEDGASAVEYGLLVAGIAALIVAIVFLFGGVIQKAFSSTCGKISSSGSANATC
jgi:pilus assembly protein Flp/PilA